MSEQPSTFCLLTGAGPAAIAVVQIVSPEISSLIQTLCRLDALPQPGEMRTTRLYLEDGDAIDETLLSRHAEHEVRLHLHGSPWIVRSLCDALRRMELGEKRTSSSQGTLDRVVEAMLPDMPTLTGVRWLADQPRRWQAAGAAFASQSPEQIRRVLRSALATRNWLDWLRTPVRIAVVGPPNAGKSTLINALTREQACLVSDTPGTTRDWIEVSAELGGLPVTWLDTAGLRESEDPLEAAGMARTRAQLAAAAGAVLVVRADDTPDWRAWEVLLGGAPLAIVSNQIDRCGTPAIHGIPPAWRNRWVCTSAAIGSGLGSLRGLISMSLGRDLTQISVISTFTSGLRRGVESLLAGPDARLVGGFQALLDS